MQPQPIGAVFDNSSFAGHEEVAFCHDRAAGLAAIIAIHDTRLGPALGGCRMWPYESEGAALRDVLRLSRAMTYKNALAGLALGGGKSVIIGDPATDKTPALLRAFAAHVDGLGGRYIAAEDVGIGVADVEVMREVTRHVRGIAEGGVGDPSPHTAHGVFAGIKAAAAYAYGTDDLAGRRIAVAGLGHVGMALARRLAAADARLVVADVKAGRVEAAVGELGAEATTPDRAHAARVDIFCPCALGGVLNERTIPEIGARIVAGAANNQLAAPKDGDRLRLRGILHAPDYVINAGGVIAIGQEGPDFDAGTLDAHVEAIGETLAAIFARADIEGVATTTVADRMAEERLAAAG